MDGKAKCIAELTSNIGRAVAAVSVQVIVGEAGASHQPRCLSDDLGSVAVGIAVDAVEHLAIAVQSGISLFVQFFQQGNIYQMTAPTLFPGRMFW